VGSSEQLALIDSQIQELKEQTVKNFQEEGLSKKQAKDKVYEAGAKMEPTKLCDSKVMAIPTSWSCRSTVQ